jgi:chromosome segregation ATPase
MIEQELASLRREITTISESLVAGGQMDDENRKLLIKNLDKIIQMKFTEKHSKLVQTSTIETSTSPSHQDLQGQLKNFEEKLTRTIEERDMAIRSLGDQRNEADNLIRQKDDQIRSMQEMMTKPGDSSSLQTEISQYIKNIGDLNNEVYRLKQEKTDLNQLIEDKNISLRNLQNRLEEAIKSLEAEAGIKTLLNTEIKQLSLELTTCKEEIRMLKLLPEHNKGFEASFTTPKKELTHIEQSSNLIPAEKKLEELMEELRNTKKLLEEKETENQKLKTLETRSSQEPIQQLPAQARPSVIGGQIDRIKIELEYKNSKVKELEEDLELTNQKLEKARADLISAQLDLDKKSSEASKLSKKMETIEFSHGEEQRKLNEMIEKLSQDLVDQKKIIVLLNQKLDEYDTHMNKLEGTLQESQKTLGDTKQSNLQIESKNKLLESEVIDKQKELEDLKKRVALMMGDLIKPDDKTDSSSLTTMKRKFDDEIKELMAENEDLRQKVRQKQQVINELELKMEQMNLDIQDYARMRTENENQKKQLQEHGKKLSSKNDEIVDLQHKLEMQAVKIDQLALELKQASQDSEKNIKKTIEDAEESYKKRIAQVLNEQSQELSAAKKQIELLKAEPKRSQDPGTSLRDSVKDQQQEILELTLQLDKANSKAAQDMKSQDDEIQRLKALLKSVGDKNEIGQPVSPTKEQEKYADQVNKIEDLNATIRQLENKISAQENQLAQRDLRLVDLEVRIKNLMQSQDGKSVSQDSDLVEFTDRMNELKVRIEKLQAEKVAEIEKFEEELNSMKRKLASKDQEIDSINRNLAKTTSNYKEAAEEVDELRKYRNLFEKMKDEIEGYEDKLQLSRNRIKDLESGLSQTSVRLFSGDDMMEKMTTQLKLASEQVSALEKSNRELKLKLGRQGT